MTGIKAGMRAFNYNTLDPNDQDYTNDSNWADWENRQSRYQLLWDYYTSSVYNEYLRRQASGYKVDSGLYEHIRPLYNPAWVIGEFYAAKVWGGRLDIHKNEQGVMVAGDSGALPIITDSERLREAIALLWRDSNWKTKRNLTTRRGAVLGDTFIEIVSDPDREKVYLKSVHPSKVKYLDLDPFGNVKGYTLEYQRSDDVDPNQTATYTERVSKDGQDVLYELFKNGSPYAWGGEFSSWSVPYGFIPLVAIQHRDMGLAWGFSEAFPKLSLFREIDDQASKLNDQIRKVVDAQYVALGASAPTATPTTTNTTPTADNPQAGRDESRIIYIPSHGDKQVTLEPLVANLNLADALQNIKFIAEQLEKEFPELALARVQLSGTELSGRAIRLIQAEPKNKIVDIRDIYDDALVRAHQMAIAIGGYSGYDGYEGYDLNSYANGDLDHQIGDRQVFSRDELDDLEVAEKQSVVFTNYAKESGASGAVEAVPHLTEDVKDSLTGGATVPPTVGL